MALLPTLVEARNRQRTTGHLDAYSDFWYGVTGGPTKSGAVVSEKTAMKYITVARCVMLISADKARLPLNVMRRFPDGTKQHMVDHPLYDVLKTSPNPETNSFLYRESNNGHVELWGNHYSTIERNKYTGDIKYLWPIEDPSIVEVRRDEKGIIFYRWRDKKGSHKKPASDIFHIPGFGFNGLVGLSILGMIREAIGLGLSNDEFAAKYFGQGMHIGGIMNIEADLGEQKQEYLKALKKEHAGMMNSHGVLVTHNGETYTQLKMPLRDAQFIEGREFQKQEIAGFYGVPAHKIGVHKQNANRNNTEQENQGYLDGCLLHRIARDEAVINQRLLTKKDRQFGIFAEYNFSGMLRGDSKARGEYYKTLWSMGYPLNRILNKENENPVDGGDKGFVELNRIPLDMAGDLAQPKTEGKSQRSIEYRAGIIIRDRISRQYHPLFVRAAEKIVNLEANAVKNKVKKFRKERAKSDMKQWIKEFYRDMPEKIKREIGPVFQSFSDAVIRASADEIGVDPEKIELKKFVSDYIETYSVRHIGSSQGQLDSILEENEIDDLETRVDEWSETRPEKIASRETVQGSSALFQAVAFSIGLGTFWRIRGAKTCPYCKELNGKRVKSGESFVNEMTELNPKDGTGPMKFRGIKAHPPLHQGCDCYLSA